MQEAWWSLGWWLVFSGLLRCKHRSRGRLSGWYKKWWSSSYQRISQYRQGRWNEIWSSYSSCYVSGKSWDCQGQSLRCCSISMGLAHSCVKIHSLLQFHEGHSREGQELSDDFQNDQLQVWFRMVFRFTRSLQYPEWLDQCLRDNRRFLIVYH